MLHSKGQVRQRSEQEVDRIGSQLVDDFVKRRGDACCKLPQRVHGIAVADGLSAEHVEDGSERVVEAVVPAECHIEGDRVYCDRNGNKQY